MSVKFANNAFGTLNAGINNSATSITLSSGQGARFPSLSSGEYFYATLIDTSNNLEVVKCTARSTDVLTVTRAQESTTAQAFAIGDRVELRITAGGLDDAANPYDKDSSSTGSFGLPVGTTAQQPSASTTEGHIRYDSDDNVIYYSDGTNWLKISSVIATLSSATGNIFLSSATTLTLAGQGFQSANLVVNFTQSSDSIDEDVSVTPTSDTAATVTVPAAVYNNVTAGNVVSITVTNSDGIESAAATKTAVALPSGGTVTTSGDFRIHTFTSSGNFVNTISSLTTQYLVIAGGGGAGMASDGANASGGGGGAGGYRSSVPGQTSGRNSSAEATLSLATGTFTVTVGAGGAGAGSADDTRGTTGGNSVFGSITSNGGGGGGGNTTGSAFSGGSGGGGEESDGAGGSGTSGQGFSGGTGSEAGNRGGGGGGAGGAGSNNGTGGAGLTSNITGSSVQRALGGTVVGNANSGGSGVGGANTGSGGGGNGQSGFAGGSGIVIVRYDLTAI